MASANVHGLRPVDSNVQHKSNSLPAETVCLVVSNVFSLSPFVIMIGIGYVSHSFSCFSPVQHGQMNKWIYRQVSKILHSQGISVQGGTISRGSFGQLVDKERDATKTRKNKLFGTEIGLRFQTKIGGGSLNCEYCQTQQEYSQAKWSQTGSLGGFCTRQTTWNIGSHPSILKCFWR